MTPREQAAYLSGIEHARQMALIAAVSLEVRDDAGEVRQRAAVAALQGLAEGLRALTLVPPSSPAHCSHVDIYNGSEAEAGRGVGS